MKIKTIEIKNYRSIKNISLELQEIAKKNCLILLGKNETGKSNILKAISLINPDYEFDYIKDCNKTAKKNSEEISISLELEFENFSFYKKQFSEFGIPNDLQEVIRVNRIIKFIKISSTDERREFLHIYLKDDNFFENYIFNNKEQTITLYSDAYSGEEKLTEDNISDLLGDDFSFLDKEQLEEFLEKKLLNTVSYNIPNPILWRPSEEFLINKPIDLNEFKSDQKISQPLKNIFRISGIKNIDKRLELIKNDIEERSQLKQELSKKVTEYINEKWPEHRINIYIEIENMRCIVMIEDKDDTLPKYRMDQRSDGFKQFISVLLNLSIESKTEEIKKKIILLDEPEIHLHPSGIKYLRDELLKISENNNVIVASHSIYMVDKLSLERHFKVSKEKSLTYIKQIEKNNPYEEEVVYEALGTSIYEHIQPNMLIFEGKTDKDLFDGFLNKYKRDLKPIKLGTISSDGVEKIPQYTKFMSGKLVKGFVLVDSDTDGVRIKEVVKKENKFFNTKNTFEINDIIKTNKSSTLEDLYPVDFIKSVINDKYNVLVDLEVKEPFIKQLRLKNKELKGKINIKELKGILVNEALKKISQLNKEDAKAEFKLYYDFIEKLNQKLKK